MDDLLKKETILKEAKEGNLEEILKFLNQTKGEDWITNEERNEIHWSALINKFNKIIDNYLFFKQFFIRDILYLQVESLFNVYKLMELFIKELSKDEFIDNDIFNLYQSGLVQNKIYLSSLVNDCINLSNKYNSVLYLKDKTIIIEPLLN